MKAKENGKFGQALTIWTEAMQVLPEASYAIAREYVRLVAEQQMKKYYEQATSLYYRGLSSGLTYTVDMSALEKDLLYLELIMEKVESDQIKLMNENRDTAGLLASIRRFWSLMDLVPTTQSNPRLIEHFVRIQQAKARFPNPDSPFGFDDRGKIWLRFGEPDKTLERELRVSSGEIHWFASEFMFATGSDGANSFSIVGESQGSSPGGLGNTSGITLLLEEKIFLNPPLGEFDAWIYNRSVSEPIEKTIFYFREVKNNVWKKIDSLEDWIPIGLYLPTTRNLVGNLTPALVLQYLYYKELTGFDSYFRTYLEQMDFEIFNKSIQSKYQIQNLALQLRSINKHTAFRNTANSPSQQSTEERKIPSIPLEIHQYRLLDELGEPVLATFVESLPASALLTDLVSNQDVMIVEEPEQALVLDDIARWYSLRQGVELRGIDGEPLGRLQSRPALMMDEQDRVPSSSLFTIPFISPETVQNVYVILENTHPETSPLQESVFPDELRGLGRLTIPQPEPLDLSGSGPVLGDLLLGYGRMEREEAGLRFPFVVSHERTIPEGENLVVHFEIYRLQTNGQGFARFEVDYEIEPKQRLFGRLLANKDNLSGTLSFEPQGTRFSESLEFEELSLERGRYTLHWTVRDLNRDNDGITNILEFEVVD
ncbi:MAG: GWxTD domain-containing protein [Balneolaceae bacterium]